MGAMRSKTPDLTMACAGRFGDHHALLARLHLDLDKSARKVHLATLPASIR